MLPFLNDASMSKTGLKRLPLVQGRQAKTWRNVLLILQTLFVGYRDAAVELIHDRYHTLSKHLWKRSLQSSAQFSTVSVFWIPLDSSRLRGRGQNNRQVQKRLHMFTHNELKNMLLLLVKCQRTRDCVWECRWGEVRGQGQSQDKRCFFFYWGSFITWCYPLGWEPGRGDVLASSSTAW